MADYSDSLKYTKEHEWTRIAGNKATVGITEFAKDQLGDVVYLELPEVGASIVRGEPFGVVESTKAVSELFAPLTGKVTKVNKDLVGAPEGVNDVPTPPPAVPDIRRNAEELGHEVVSTSEPTPGTWEMVLRRGSA